MANETDKETEQFLAEMKTVLVERFREVSRLYNKYDPHALQALAQTSQAYINIVEQERKIANRRSPK